MLGRSPERFMISTIAMGNRLREPLTYLGEVEERALRLAVDAIEALCQQRDAEIEQWVNDELIPSSALWQEKENWEHFNRFNNDMRIYK